MVLELEAELRLDVERRGLQLDIRNMFNEVCRTILQEDLLDSRPPPKSHVLVHVN